MSTTRWKDTQNYSLDEVIEVLLRDIPDEITETMLSWRDFKTTKSFDENQEIRLNGVNISFNLIRYSFVQVTQNAMADPVNKEGFIIVYFNGTEVNYIINQNSNAQKLLRKLLNYKGQKEIENNMHSFESDFFIWILSRVYNYNNSIESEGDNLKTLQLESIKSFKGDTEDSQTKVSATGESVMNIISTLSFLLESNRINQIKLNLEYGSHENIDLIIKKDVVSVDIKSYQGEYENDLKDLCISKIYLLIYLEILTILKQEYLSDKDNDLWNKQEYINFMNIVASDIEERITLKIELLNDK